MKSHPRDYGAPCSHTHTHIYGFSISHKLKNALIPTASGTRISNVSKFGTVYANFVRMSEESSKAFIKGYKRTGPRR